MELMKHVAKHHYKDKDEDSKLSSDEVLDNILLKDLEEKYELKKDSSFVFTESMLDEFLDKKEEWNSIIIKTWRIMTSDGLLANF